MSATEQREVARRLVLRWDGRPVATIAGLDALAGGDVVRGAVAVCRFPGLDLLAAGVAVVPRSADYVPGSLALAEAPALRAAWAALAGRPDAVRPDVLLFDAHGTAHPRGAGLASQLGVEFGVPSIGVAKSRLWGTHGAVGDTRGSRAPLFAEDEPSRVVGAVVRTRAGVRPVYVSPGHLIDLETAIALVLAAARRFRIPEPLRRADALTRT